MKTHPALLLALSLLCGSASAQNNTTDDFPNASPGFGLVIQADGTASANGRINYADDLDVFSFQVGSNSTLTVYTTGTTDTKGVLRRSSSAGWTTLVTEEGGTGNFRIVRTVEPGLFSIQVSGKLGTAIAGTVSGAYGLRVELTPAVPPPPGDIEVPEVARGGGVAFGSVALNTAVTKSFTLRNTGAGNLQIAGVTLAGTTAGGNGGLVAGPFWIENGGARTLAPNASAVFQVIFRPVAAGNFTGTVNIGSNDPDENPYNFTVTGSGAGDPPPPPPPGDIEVPEVARGGSVAFGSAPLNTSVTKSFTLRNAGAGDLQINGVALTGTAAGGANGPATGLPFLIENGGARALAPNGSAIFQVVFRPLAAGNFTAVVSIGSNDPDENPYSFTVTGSGASDPPPPPAGGEIGVRLGDADVPSGGMVDFGVVMVPSTAQVVRELIISNTGETNLQLGAVVIAPLPTADPVVGPPPGFFRVLTPPAAVVEPGRTTVLRIGAGALNSLGALAPAGIYLMQATIENSDSNENPYRLLLRAEVKNPPPPAAGEIAVFAGDAELSDDGTLDFGTTRTGVPVTRTLTIKNTGEGELRLNGIVVEWSGAVIAIFPPPPPPFRVEGGEPRTIAPGASTTCHVIFPATWPGPAEAILRINNTDADENPFSIALKANAEGDPAPPPAPEIAVGLGGADLPNGGTVSFGRTSLTVPVKRTLAISNRGTAPLQVRAGFQAVTRGVLNTVQPFRFSGEPFSSVPPGATRDLSIVFQPVTNGAFQIALIISNNDADENPYRLKLTGEGGTDPTAVPDMGLRLGDADLLMGGLVDFGTVEPGRSVTKEIKITNSGNGDLHLGRITFAGNTPTPGGGVDANGVVILPPVGALPFRALPPPNNVVPAGGFAILRVVYVAPPSGSHAAVISIESNDPDENPWTLHLKGASSGTPPVAPEIAVSSGNAELPIGGTLNFGTVRVGTPVRREIAIANTGGGELRITGFSILPAEMLANDGAVFLPPPALVRVVSGPGIIPAGGRGVFVLEMIGFAPGTARLSARITNNDPDENPYSFGITGTIQYPEPNDPAVGDPAGNTP